MTPREVLEKYIEHKYKCPREDCGSTFLLQRGDGSWYCHSCQATYQPDEVSSVIDKALSDLSEIVMGMKNSKYALQHYESVGYNNAVTDIAKLFTDKEEK